MRPNLSLSLGLRYEYNTPAREVQRPHRGHVPRGATRPCRASHLHRRARAHLRPRPQQLLAAPRLRLRAALVRRAGRDAHPRRLRTLQRPNPRRGRQPVAQRLPDLRDGQHGGRLRQPPLSAVAARPAEPVEPEPRARRARHAQHAQPERPARRTPQRASTCSRAPGGVLPGASGVEATLPARKLEAPEAHHYALTFEQRFGRDTFLSVAYVGTQARNLLRFSTPNLGTNAVSLLRSFDIDDGRRRPLPAAVLRRRHPAGHEHRARGTTAARAELRRRAARARTSAASSSSRTRPRRATTRSSLSCAGACARAFCIARATRSRKRSTTCRTCSTSRARPRCRRTV